MLKISKRTDVAIDNLDKWASTKGNGKYISPNFVTGDEHGDVAVQQIRQELYEFGVAVESNHLLNGTLLEIGLGNTHGGTSIFWRGLFDKVISVELVETRIQRWASENASIMKDTNIIYDKSTNSDFSKKHTIVLGRSQDVKLVEFIKNHVISVNVVFIDGEHSYGAVKEDTHLYGPLVKQGIVAWHDYLAECWGIGRFLKDYSVGVIDNKNHEVQYIGRSRDLGIAYERKL